MSRMEIRLRGSKEILAPAERLSPEEALAYLEAEAARALEEGYGRMHYRTDRLVARLTLRRPRTSAVPVYVSTPAQKRLFEETTR